MNGTLKGCLGLVYAVGLLATPAARADVAPPDACFTENEVCQNAGGSFDQEGICTATTCTKGPPGDEITYDCLVCEAAAAGAAGTGGVAGGAGAAGMPDAAGAGGMPEAGGTGGTHATGGKSGASGMAGSPVTPTDDDDDDGCSCSSTALGSEKGAAALMLVLGLAALGVSRRRR